MDVEFGSKSSGKLGPHTTAKLGEKLLAIHSHMVSQSYPRKFATA
jgi:hypothetical protein